MMNSWSGSGDPNNIVEWAVMQYLFIAGGYGVVSELLFLMIYPVFLSAI